MSMWDSFDKQINDDFTKQVNDAAASEGTRPDPIKGEYEVKLLNLGLVATKDGRPMAKAEFVITGGMQGRWNRNHLFFNRVLFGTKSDAKMIASIVGWVKTLGASYEDGQPVEIKFVSFSQFARLLDDVMGEIEAEGIDYLIDYDPQAFNSIRVKEILDPM